MNPLVKTIVGLVLVLVSLILINFKIVLNLSMLVVQINLFGTPINANLSPIVWYFLLILGIIFISRGLLFNPEYPDDRKALTFQNDVKEHLKTALKNKENIKDKRCYLEIGSDKYKFKFLQFRSISWSRILATLLIIVTAIIQAKKFGISFADESIPGHWQFLGGPSLFFPTSVFPLLVAVPLIFCSIFSYAKIHIGLVYDNTSGDNDIFDSIYVYEKRFGLTYLNLFEKNNIASIQYNKSKIGPHHFWLVYFGIQIWFLGVDAFSFLTDPFRFGMEIEVGYYYLFQVAVDFIVLVLLTFFAQNYFQIRTLTKRKEGKEEQKLFELQFFAPRFLGSKKRNYNLINLFSENMPTTNSNTDSVSNPLNKSKGAFKLEKTSEVLKNNKIMLKIMALKVLIGVIFISVAFITQIFKIYSSEALRITLFISGLIFLFNVLKTYIYGMFKGDTQNKDSGFIITALDKNSVHDNHDSTASYKKLSEYLDFFEKLIIFIVPLITAISMINFLLYYPHFNYYINFLLIQIMFFLIINIPIVILFYVVATYFKTQL
ncbi:MAG: hypothetical protein ACTSU2_16700 [Promethearchaeota archaeon]